ncbi:hypothetical protein F0363_09445 [Orientia tsutsugamushi]|nr:hypothetical protein F0363_09445 [Orientia tsutsugamushi]
MPNLYKCYHVHHLVSARMFYCLRFTTVVTFSSIKLAIWCASFSFHNWTFTSKIIMLLILTHLSYIASYCYLL